MAERQKNQHRMLMHDTDLTEGAERLLLMIEKYQYIYNVTNTQYSYLMGISLRNTVKYVNELLKKGYIKIMPETRKRGQGLANTYEAIKKYVPFQEDNQ